MTVGPDSGATDAGGAAEDPRVARVADPADPRVADFLDVRERDLVGRRGRFVAEGEVVLRLLAERAPHLVRAVLVVDRRLPRIRPLLPRLPADTPVLVAGQPVADALTGLHLNRGILAIADKPQPPPLDRLLTAAPARATVPVLAGLANHDNVGGVLRNAAAFGAPFAIADRETADPFYRKAVRVSVGGSVLVPVARTADLPGALDALEAAGFALLALTPRETAADIGGLVPPPRAAVLLGTEGPGLPEALLARATPVRIPMAEGFDSLNVAVASGIVLSALFAARG